MSCMCLCVCLGHYAQKHSKEVLKSLIRFDSSRGRAQDLKQEFKKELKAQKKELKRALKRASI